MAAVTHLGWNIRRSHRAKFEATERLHREQGLPDISRLLPALNTARKAVGMAM
jgi:hypothetical protein